MKPENAIEVRDLRKTYRVKNESQAKSGFPNRRKYHEVKAADGISFDVRKGEVVGLIGRNGSGKSTLLSMIAGIMYPDEGEIEISGKAASILELGMGFKPDLSGRDNIYIKGELYGLSREEIDKKIDRIIEYSGIGDSIDLPVRTYSTGMTGKLAFSIMINVEADILLVDEILSVGDISFMSKANSHFRKLAREGKTILLASHAMSAVKTLCNRVIWIEKGKIVENGDPNIVCSHYEMKMKESPDVLRDLVDCGDTNAMNTLGTLYRDGNGVEKNPSQAFELIEAAAESGNTEAQVNLGDMYWSGEGTNKDPSKAYEWYRRAAEKNDPNAMKRLSSIGEGGSVQSIRQKTIDTLKDFSDNETDAEALFLAAEAIYHGKRNPSDFQESLRLYKKSAELGSIQAMFQLGMIYSSRKDLPRDIPSAINYYTKAADQGEVRSQLALADMFYNGVLVKKDLEKAFLRYKQAAENRNYRAEFRVATMYLDGEGTAKNQSEAEIWFKKASEFDLQNTFFKIGLKYESRGNKEKAFEWYMHGADCGHIPSVLKVAYSYRTGIGTGKDLEKAAKYYLYGTYANNLNAIICLSDMLYSGEISDPSYGKIIEDSARKMADSGNSIACRTLGEMYYRGKGIPKDAAKAIEWYARGCELGDGYSGFMGGNILRNGEGVPKDTLEAAKLYSKASELGNIGAIIALTDMALAKDLPDSSYVKIAEESARRMADTGNAVACRVLGDMYFRGKGVPNDASKAIEWYARGSELGDAVSANMLKKIKSS